jgi:galactokinase
MIAAKTLGVPLLVDASAAALDAAETRMPRSAYKRARHIIDEIARVGHCVDALRAGDLAAVGKLLVASHRSSRVWFENSTPELDFLVDRLVAEPAVYGARLTGGGFGGAVMALTSEDFDLSIAQAVAADTAERFGTAPEVLHARTGDGASLEPSASN